MWIDHRSVRINGKDIAFDFRFWLYVWLAMALGSEATHIFLYGEPAILAFTPTVGWRDWMKFIGTFAGIPAWILWIGARRVPFNPFFRWLALAAGLGLVGLIIGFDGSSGIGAPQAVFVSALSPLGILILLACCWSAISKKENIDTSWRREYMQLGTLLAALSVGTHASLSITRVIYPATWDYYAYRIDGAYAGIATTFALINAKGEPLLQAFSNLSYASLIIALYAIVGLAIRNNAVKRLHIWRTLALPFALAFLLYSWLPITGPIYAFFDGHFPAAMPHFTSVVSSQVIVPPASRNGMPSMHLTGALIVWMLAIGLRNRIGIGFSTLLVAVTIWSTLALGEHYLIDLIVALPYAAFLGAALIWPQHFKGSKQTSLPIWLSGFTFLTWMIWLRVAPGWLGSNLDFVRALSAWSVVVSIWVFWRLIVEARGLVESPETSLVDKVEKLASLRAPVWIIGIFTASGIAGLVYEVVYAKALAVTFGSTAVASYTVLATYMGGMALGAWLGGYLADRSKFPLKTYAICEALIGLYAALTPKLFVLIQDAYVYFSADVSPDAGWLTIFRVSLGAACLGIPTIIMGMTMPLMFKHLRGLGVESSHAIAPLYGANVVGAALGSILAGYLILPAVGRNGGTYLAAVMSLLIGLYVLERDKRADSSAQTSGGITPSFQNQIALQVTPLVAARHGAVALFILFLGGAVTLGLEVNSMHLLAAVAGNSVYAFALMLATFLAGLGLGSHVGERLMTHFPRLTIVSWAQFGVAFAIAVTAHLWDDIPSYFSSFGIYPVRLSFSAREMIRAMVCTVAMLPPAFFIGMSYPSAMGLASDWLSPKGGAKGLGLASGLNTLGNILGVLIIGFWLLPEFGSRNSALVLALVSMALGILALLVSPYASFLKQLPLFGQSLKWGPALVAAAVLMLFPKDWSYDDLSKGGNVYFSAQNWGKVIDHAESVEGGVTSVAKNENGVITLLTNGKFQGNDSKGGEMIAQESFALFPLLHTPKRDSALVIGYGTGMTTRVLHDYEFKRVDVAELSKDIVTMANRYFDGINQAVMKKPGVRMHYTDGRNYLLTQSQQFDLISIEITSIWFAGAANLYNRDFYALAKKRLTQSGVLQQWVQLHHMSKIDLAYVIGSVRSEFKYVWLYVRGGQGIIIASNNPDSLSLPGATLLKAGNHKQQEGHRPEQLAQHLMLSPAGVDRFISSLDPTMSQLVSTDVNLYLEHSTPKGNALGDVVQSNLDLLAGFEPAKPSSAESAAQSR